MRTHLDPKMRQLLADMQRARELSEDQQFDDARRALVKLRAECARSGIRSAHLAWGMAIACEGLGDYAAALDHVREALSIDPLAIPYQRSYDIIVERIRKELGDETRAPTDPTTPQLYDLLVRAGEGDVASHLAMARWHHHSGDHAAALKLLDAITTLSPHSRQAWALKSVVARAMGDFSAASVCEIEAAALDGGEVLPFRQSLQARG